MGLLEMLRVGSWGWKPNRPDRRDFFDHAVGAPTNRQVGRLNAESLKNYRAALNAQDPRTAKDPDQRAAALQVAKKKAGIEEYKFSVPTDRSPQQ